MRRILTLSTVLVSLLIFSACSSSRKSAASKQDKDLFNAIKAIEKKNNADARRDLPMLYEQAVQRHEMEIAAYKLSQNPERWINIIAELQALQNIYSAINASPATAKLVSAQSYSAAITDARESGAAEYYDKGVQYLQSDDRDDARIAYKAFQAVNMIYPDYKDAPVLLRKAKEKGTLDVVISEVESRGYFYTGGSFAADNFQRNLVRDLGGSYGTSSSGARFYTEWEARSSKVEPDWVVDLLWSNMYISPIRTNTYSRTVSKDIQSGKDTSGRPVYQTVTATLRITQTNINAQADMEYNITDLKDEERIEGNRVPAYLNAVIETATYSGDSRALSTQDWNLVNNRRYAYMNEGEIVEALYREVYPQLRNRIEAVTRW
ncbi:MAG TPA: hypothetical protein VEV87_10550 [Chitinophagaceae bacterium]|nr:hypothetical protein [Chitinophagaceae bacterium]